MDQYSSTLDQIQRLSNERQHLYFQKWSKRNQADFRDRIKALNGVIADLWHEHRCELAESHRPAANTRTVEQSQIQYYSEQMGAAAPSGYQVRDGDRWRNTDADALAGAIGRYVADIPADDPDEIVEVPPLKEILRRRGLTLQWESAKGGAGYHRLISFSI